MIPFLVRDEIESLYGKPLKLPDGANLLVDTKHGAWQSSEHELQKAYFAWLAGMMQSNFNFYLAHAIPNGGTRNKIEAGRLKAEGVKAGIPDVFLPLPSKGYHGLYIEFKAKTNKPSEDQIGVICLLLYQGYKVLVINNLEIAKKETLQYLGYEG